MVFAPEPRASLHPRGNATVEVAVLLDDFTLEVWRVVQFSGVPGCEREMEFNVVFPNLFSLDWHLNQEQTPFFRRVCLKILDQYPGHEFIASREHRPSGRERDFIFGLYL